MSRTIYIYNKEKTMNKNVLSSIKFIIILVAVFFGVRMLTTYVPGISGFQGLSIQTNSMEPLISIGDYVVVKEIDANELEVQDIIAFNVDINANGTEEIVVHYVDEIITENGELSFKTKAEIADVQDTWTISADDVVGVYTFQVNNIGAVMNFLSTPIGKLIVIVDVIALYLIINYVFKSEQEEYVEQEDENNEQDPKIKEQSLSA
jgi:signal peptidase